MYLRVPTIWLVALCCVLVFVVPSSLLVTVVVLLVLAVAGLDALLAPAPRVLDFARDEAPTVNLGSATTTRLRVTNPSSRRVRGALRDAWTPGAGPGEERREIDLAPGDTLVHEVPLTPTRRGWRPAAGVTVRSRGPIGLAGRQSTLAVPGHVAVLPAFTARRFLPSRLVQLREMEGRAQVRAAGQGSEFDSLRDFVRGDDVRSIDWRATARRRAPVVRTWRPERDRRLSLVLDTSRLSAGRLDDTTRLDAGMEACLLLAALASRAGDTVHWCAGDRVVRAAIPADPDSSVVPLMLRSMAPLEPHLLEPDWPTLIAAATRGLRQGSLVVLVTPLEPTAVTEALVPHLPALLGTYRVVIASAADPDVARMAAAREDVASVYDAAAAEHASVQRAQLRAALERQGVWVLDEAPERLAPSLADLYLQLKRDGRL